MRRVRAVIASGCVLSGLTATVLAFSAAPVSTAPASAASSCDRACLLGFVDQYLTAFAAHDVSVLLLAPNVAYTENGTKLPLGGGLWKTVTAITGRREAFADVTNGQAAFWGVLDEQGAPVMLSLRLKIQDQRISEVEAVVTRKGSHALFSPETFAAPVPVFDEVLSASQRTPRDRLIAAANGYFDGLQQHDNRLVPSAVDCNRFENGVRMTNRPGATPTPRACAMAVDSLTYIKAVYNRRYDVVDDERGVVLSMVLFNIPEDASATPPRAARTLLLAELFKVVSGEILRIETVMHNLPYGSASGWAGQ